MPDWQELVRQRLSSLALDAEEKDEVQVELAAHLEESYEVFCKEGLPEKEAVHRTFEQVADWQDFHRKKERTPHAETLAPALDPWVSHADTFDGFPGDTPEPRIPRAHGLLEGLGHPFLRAVAAIASFLRSSGNLRLVPSWGFAANRASRQRLSRARAYWGVSLDVSDRLAHRTNHRKASRF